MNASIWTEIFIPLVLMAMMVGVGLSLTIADFTRAWASPKPTVVGLFAKLVLLPAIGYLLVLVLGVPPAIAIGVMVLAFCPGGQTSNIFTHLARGDAALSVTLTVLSLVVTMVTLPLLTNLTLAHFGHDAGKIRLSFLDTAIHMFTLVILPTGAGMLVRARWPRLASRLQTPLDRGSLALLFLLIVVVVAQIGSRITVLIVEAGPICVLLCALTMAASYGLSRLTGLALPQAKAVMFEAGIQNAAFTIVIATSILHAPEFAVPAVVYGVVMNLGGLVTMLFIRRRFRKADAALQPAVAEA